MARTKAGSPANQPPLKFKNGSGDLMKELQKMVCLQVLEHITCYGKTKDKHKIWPAAHEKYYGPSRRAEGDERMSYVEKAHRGLEMFQFLYKIEDNLQGYAGPQRVLNQELLGRSADAPRIVSSFKEGDLTIQILSCHSFGNRQHLAGRTIWGNGKKTVAQCKKMLALVKVSEYKDGLPSGRNFADYVQYVREQYWKTFELPNILKKELNGTEATAEASDAGDDGDDNEDEEDPEVLPTLDENLDPEKVQEYMDKHMKEKWFPSGILSFALWGPIRPDGCDETYISRCFYKSMDELSYGNGSKNKSKDGRGSMRKQHAADEASDRASASVSEGRGINTNQLLLSGSVAQAQLNTRINLLNKSNDRKYHYLQQMYRDAKEAELELYNRIPEGHIDGDWNNPEFRKGKPALEMWYKAMEEVRKCKNDLDLFMTMENKSAEEDPKVLELTEMVDQSLAPMLKRPKLADEIRSHVESSGVPPIPAQVSHNSAARCETPITETTGAAALETQEAVEEVEDNDAAEAEALVDAVTNEHPQVI
jgi:hypothetical protein